MSRNFVRWIAVFLGITGIATVVYVLLQIPPYQSDGALDILAVFLLFLGLLSGLTGIGTLLALSLHRRWPGLSGAKLGKNNGVIRLVTLAALRQGFLASVSLCAILLFSMLRILDSIFIFVIFLLVGLVETYFQSLEHAS